LEKTGKIIRDFVTDELKKTQLGEAFKSGKSYKNKFFRTFNIKEEIPEEIEVPIVAIIDEIPFARL